MIVRVLPAIALAAACSGGSTMRVRLDVSACVEEASQITLPCEGVIGVWLVDAQARVLEESCIPLERGTPLFVLDDILRDQVAFGGRTPGEIVAIELGVFEGQFGDPPLCPRDDVSSFVFGRSDPFEVGAVTDVDLILTCFDTSNECDPAFVVNATLTEFATAGVPQISATLLAGVVDDTMGPPKFLQLAELVPDGNELWSGQLAAPPEGACFASVLQDASPLLPLLSCDSTVNESTRQGFIEAYTVEANLRSTAEQELVTGAGVLGRVVDEAGFPVGDALVEAGGALVEYFNESMTQANAGGGTASHGLFLVHGPGSQCCQTITATGSLPPGGTGRGSRRTGHVADHLVTTVIRLGPANQ